uniref:DNA-directed RNA polymerase n=1 Tax=viral metagenome TaxID=1070528 RepID=A0A6C0IDZ4_9ZZZZ
MEQQILKTVEKYLETYDNASIQKQSYDFFIHHRLNKIVEEEPTIEIPLGEDRFYCVKFGQVFVDKPYIIDENRQVRYITPHEARIRDLTYSSAISVNIRTCITHREVETESKEFFKVLIARLPMMIGTSKCNLYDMTPEQKHAAGECKYDTGGYFVVKGKERVLVSQERMNYNIVYVFEQKPGSKFLLVSEIRSMSEETGHSVLLQMKITNDKKIVLQVPYMTQEIPLGIVFSALQFTPNEMMNIFEWNLGKEAMADPVLSRMIRSTLRDAEMFESVDKALAYIAQFAVHNVSKERKLFYAHQILHNELLPHLGITSSRLQKGYFLGHMLSKLVLTFTGKRTMDDRDHINNKRVEVSGHLLSELFRTLFKRFVRAMEPQLVKRPDIMVIISRMNMITQGIKHCFSTGNWGIPKSSYIRTGVSQILSRLTYNAFLSHLRRILIPVGKEGKNTKIRQVHPSQIGFICPHETPEGHCLVADTPILLEDGVSVCNMGDLEHANVSLLAVDITSGKTVPTAYHNFFRVMPESLFEVELVNGTKIRASGMHPFLTLSKKQQETEWVPTQEITVGMRLGYRYPLTRLPTHDIVDVKDTLAARIWGVLGMDVYRKKGMSHHIHCPKELDVNALLQDLQRIVPHPNEVKRRGKSFLEWDPSTADFLAERFEVEAWVHKMELPTWISKGSVAVQREWIAAFLTAHHHHFMNADGSPRPWGFQIQEWEKGYPFSQQVLKILNRVCKGWDMESAQHDSKVTYHADPKKMVEMARCIGVRYHPRAEKKLALVLLSHDARGYWDDQESMRRDVCPLPDSDLLFVPVRRIRSLPRTEMVMDLTTENDHHTFFAHGLATHNSSGIVKNMALSVQVSTRVDTVYLRMVVEEIDSFVSLQAWSDQNTFSGVWYKVLVNGNWIGVSKDKEVYNTLQRYKKTSRLSHMVSVSVLDREKEIHVYGDEGRMLRPLWDVKNLPSLDDLQHKSVAQLLEEKKMVFLDSYELENHVVAMTMEELVDKYYDYCEIHPSLLMGLCVSIIPFVDHTQAPRVTYHASMGKQAIGYYATTHERRVDTISHVLCYPEKPLIRTHYGHASGCDDLSSGNNLIVAICMYTGFNQEDSVIFNQSALDRGLFRSLSYRTMTVEERKKSTTHTESIELPSPELRIKSFNYTKLNANGIVKVGIFVGSGDVLVGRVQTKSNKLGAEEKTDTSVIIKSGEEGYVDRVYITTSPDGYRLIKVRIRTLKIPEIGDKVASRSAQKGTIGMVYRQEDMPFSSTTGMVPDVLINPLCIPSRMTINQLIECLGAKSSAHKARYRYSTPFSSHSTDVVDELREELQGCGLERNGNETLVNGFSGEMFEAEIFMGPTYYHRLKHLVSAKIHARNHGSLQALTRQPLEGRSRDGGLRFGEMERDTVSGDAEISLRCGLSIKLESMKESGWDVLGWSSSLDGIVSKKQTAFLDKGEKECVDIYLEDGRKLKCTPDHPMLTSENKWVRAKDLIKGETRLKTGVHYPLMEVATEIAECSGWSLVAGGLTLRVVCKESFFDAMAFMRILGLLITDGGVYENAANGGKYARISVGHEIDVRTVLDDLNRFCSAEARFSLSDQSYNIIIPKELSRHLIQLEGITVGRKVTQPATLPAFVLAPNFPKPLLREFLGGMFGGDGHTCILGMHRGKRDLLTSVSYSKSLTKPYLPSLTKLMEDMTFLLNRMGIQNITIQKFKETSFSKEKRKGEEKCYQLTLHLDMTELRPFHEKIGFRYCCHKSQRLEAGVAYKRLRDEVARQHNWLTYRVDEITGFSKIKAENPEKIVPTKKAILQAVEELKTREPLIHDYAIPSTHDITDHLVKGTQFGKFTSKSFPNAEEFMIKTGAICWFVEQDEAVVKSGHTCYSVPRDKMCLPTMDMTVLDVRPCAPSKVYDIEVDEINSFLANGIVAHNCMISHGVSRFLTERLFDMSDKFTVPVCSQCGAIPNTMDTCHHCESLQIRRTPLPYACKLLFQELGAMGIKIHLFPTEKI